MVSHTCNYFVSKQQEMYNPSATTVLTAPHTHTHLKKMYYLSYFYSEIPVLLQPRFILFSYNYHYLYTQLQEGGLDVSTLRI